jgi:hypothetical protein
LLASGDSLAMSDVTRIRSAIEQGDTRAAEQLLPLVYDELRRLASQRLGRKAPGKSLQSSDLVHEAYLRLVGEGDQKQWDGRGHFFAAAAEAMRRRNQPAGAGSDVAAFLGRRVSVHLMSIPDFTD